MQAVYNTAEAAGLFAENDIKVRINPYTFYKLGKNKNGFVHGFVHTMQGRNTEQKAALSRSVIQKLNGLLPDVSILSMNVQEFEAATYCTKSLIHPLNNTGNRHFRNSLSFLRTLILHA